MSEKAYIVVENDDDVIVEAKNLSKEKGYNSKFYCCGKIHGVSCNCEMKYSAGGKEKGPYFYPANHDKGHIPGCPEAHTGESVDTVWSDHYAKQNEDESWPLYGKPKNCEGQSKTGNSGEEEPSASRERTEPSLKDGIAIEERVPRNTKEALIAANQHHYTKKVIAPNTLSGHLEQQDFAGEHLVVATFAGDAKKKLDYNNDFFFFQVRGKSHGEFAQVYFGIRFCNKEMQTEFWETYKCWSKNKNKYYGVILFGQWKCYGDKDPAAWFVDYDYDTAARVVLLTNQDAEKAETLLSPDWKG